jgi:hypothetical protein
MVLFSALMGCLVGGAHRLVETVPQSMGAQGIDELEITNDGDVAVEGQGQTGEIAVEFKLWSSHENSDHDEEANHAFHVELRELGAGRAQATAWLEEDAAEDGYWVGIEVRMPDRIRVDADIDHGDVAIERVGALSLLQGEGDVAVQDVAGDLSIDDEGGDLVVDGVGGDAEIHDGGGDLVVQNVGGDLDLWDGAGDIVIGEVGGRTEIHESGSGELVIE